MDRWLVKSRRWRAATFGACRVVALLSLLVFQHLAPSAAYAQATKGEWVLSGLALYSGIPDDSRSWHGGGVGIDAAYGLTETWSVRMTAASTAQRQAGEPDLGHVQHAALGLAGNFDVFSWIPWASVQLGWYRRGGALSETALDPLGVALSAGFDYRPLRSVSAGVWLTSHRQIALRTSTMGTSAGLRVSWRWRPGLW